MNLATTFHVLEHLNDFEVIGYGGHFVFQNKAKTFADQDLHGLSLHSEAIAPIIREKQGHFSVMTPFNLEVGGHRSNSTSGKDSQGHEFLQVVYTFRTLRSNSNGDIRLLNRITLFDIKHVIWRPFCFLN